MYISPPPEYRPIKFPLCPYVRPGPMNVILRYNFFFHEVIWLSLPAWCYFYYQHFHRVIGRKVQVVSPSSTFQIKFATPLACMHTQNLYFINKYFQLCESGIKDEGCNICEQNQVSLDTPSKDQPR